MKDTVSLETRQEQNPLKRGWIWFWYNDTTRLLGVLLPSYFAVLLPLLLWLGLPAAYMRETVSLVYILVVAWAMIDNDYTNLNRIGLDAYRRPLNQNWKKNP